VNYKISDRKNQSILNNLVIIDGFSSSGKSLFTPIFGHLQRCEQWQIDYKYEYIASLEALNKIDKDAAKGLLNIWTDNHIYDLFISRNINLRPTDMTSPYRDGLEEKYLKRLIKKDGDTVLDEIKDINPILVLHIHYIIGFSDILVNGFGDKLKLYAITLRNPIELIKIWYEGNWAKRIGADSRDYQLCIEKDSEMFPWFVSDYIDEYKEANDIEKSILIVYYFHKKMFDMIDNLEEKDRKKIMFVPFEKFTVNPDSYIDQVCSMLETRRNYNFSEIMVKLDLPRKNTQEIFSLNEFNEQYSKDISDKYINLLSFLSNEYKQFI